MINSDKLLKLPIEPSYEERMTWRMRWFLIIAITIAYTLPLLGGLTGYWVTSDLHFLLFVTPTALIPLVRYLVPMDKRRYDLKVAEIEANKRIIQKLEVRIRMLEVKQRKREAKNE